MFDIIKKDEFFSWLEAGTYFDKKPRLKSVQYSYIISKLINVKGCKIAEIGGGNSRVLDMIKENNECWNIDKFEDVGNGPREIVTINGIKNVKAYIGEFSAEVPAGYFDYVFSISVLEHVLNSELCNFFKDIERILKVGGETFHAIDCYLGDDVCEKPIWIEYLNSISKVCSNMQLLVDPKINKNTVFCSDMASDPDINMWNRNQLVPRLRPVSAKCQCVSIKAEWVKNKSYDNKEKDTILVYTMGKVASSSIDRTLKTCGFKTKHFHYFNGDFNTSHPSVQSQMGMVNLRDYKGKIVTLTRDPVARNISAFFQNIKKFCEVDFKTSEVQKTIEVFLRKYNNQIPLDWFDKEFKLNTGVDVYATTFDKTLGYCIIEKNNLKILIIKSEIVDQNKIKALKFFLGEEFYLENILHSNCSKNKNYYDLYSAFLKKINFKNSFIDSIYDSKYAKHFYTDDELNSFRFKWMSNS